MLSDVGMRYNHHDVHRRQPCSGSQSGSGPPVIPGGEPTVFPSITPAWTWAPHSVLLKSLRKVPVTLPKTWCQLRAARVLGERKCDGSKSPRSGREKVTPTTSPTRVRVSIPQLKLRGRPTRTDGRCFEG